jgi:hypothetical protein
MDFNTAARTAHAANLAAKERKRAFSRTTPSFDNFGLPFLIEAYSDPKILYPYTAGGWLHKALHIVSKFPAPQRDFDTLYAKLQGDWEIDVDGVTYDTEQLRAIYLILSLPRSNILKDMGKNLSISSAVPNIAGYGRPYSKWTLSDNPKINSYFLGHMLKDYHTLKIPRLEREELLEIRERAIQEGVSSYGCVKGTSLGGIPAFYQHMVTQRWIFEPSKRLADVMILSPFDIDEVPEPLEETNFESFTGFTISSPSWEPPKKQKDSGGLPW